MGKFPWKNGQASIELLVLISLFLVMMLVSFAATSSTSKDAVIQAKASKAAQVIAHAADQVYSQGPGSEMTVLIELPENVTSSSSTGGAIQFDFATSAGPSSALSAIIAGDSIGKLPTAPGQHFVTLRLLSDGRLSLGGFYTIPDSLSFSVSTSSSQTKEFDLLNETGAKVEVIDAKATGDIAGSGWTVSVQDLNSSLVNDSNDNDAKIHVSVTGAVSAGTYTGTVDVNARNASTGSEEKASIEVTVVVTSAGPGCSLTVSTYSSPLCLVPATTFNAGDVVYVKAITDNCTVTDGNIALNYPDYNTRYSSTGMGVIDSTTGVCVSFSTASTDPTGTWTAQASSLSGQANLDTQGLEMIPQCSLDIAMFDSFLCTTQASSFRQDQNAYAKVVTDNCTITDGNVEFFSPANSLEQSYTGEAVDNVVGVCKRFTIDTSTPTGTWTAKAGSPAQLAGADSTTFQVTPVCTLSVGTYSDSSCLLSDTTILKPSQDPYVKVSVGPGCSPNDVNIKVKQPDGTLKTGWQNQTVTDSSAFCQQVDITQGDPSGTWLADANSAQAYGATSTFSVSSECTFTLGTYSDSLCLTPGSSFSKPSEDPYVKVSISAGCSVSDANVRVKQPDGSLDQLWTGQTVNATTSFCQKDNITGSDPTGTWTAVAESNSVDSVSVTFEMT